MRSLPSTPAEVLDISTRRLRFRITMAVKSAELFGYWRHPYQDAATSFEEMTLSDIYYWVYKCTNPITRAEKGERIADQMVTDSRVAALPHGFETQSSLTIGAGGDLLQAAGLEQSKDVLFESIADLLFDQTVSYANFESPITTQPLQKEVIGDRAAPIQCCSREQFDVLKGHRGKCFTVLNTANNHMFDMGVEGVDTTLRGLAEHSILDTGTNRAPDEHGQGKFLTSNGIKLGFVSATFGLNGHVMPPGDDHRINVATLLSKFSKPDLRLIKRQIDHCKGQGCDFIIASLHWGFEFEFFPRRQQVEIAHTLVEWGADAIIGHHAHVIQPVEYYRTRRDPSRIAVIAYSVGTLVWGYTAPHLVLGMILSLTLAKGMFQGKARTYIEQAGVTPVFRSSTSNEHGIVTRLEKLADHVDGRRHLHSPDYIAEIKRYADLVLEHIPI
jgi:capsule synthesis protein PGA_cap